MKHPKGPQVLKKEDLQNCKRLIMESPKINNLIEIMVYNNAYDQQNLFRVTVDGKELDELADIIARSERNTNVKVSMEKYSNHHLGMLLKKYLHEFDDSVFPSRFLGLYHLLGDLNDQKSFCENLQLINMLIPSSNTKLLKVIPHFICDVFYLGLFLGCIHYFKLGVQVLKY